MQNQKTYARLLDTAAARADRAWKTPATGKQCWFLAGLIAAAEEKGIDATDIMFRQSVQLTKARASQEISSLIELGITLN